MPFQPVWAIAWWTMALESARTLLYNPLDHFGRGGQVIEQAVIDEGVRLTVVGMGTAFALLLVLTLVVTLMGAAFRWAANRGVVPEDPEARDRAVAAAVAVGVMRARSPGDGPSA